MRLGRPAPGHRLQILVSESLTWLRSDSWQHGIRRRGRLFDHLPRGTPALVVNTIFDNTTCPDGTNSDNDGNTCTGHWLPIGEHE